MKRSLGKYYFVLSIKIYIICYRVYEALGTGSTPIIEDVATKGHCTASPWRLLKKHDPPVIWVKTWDNLGKVFAKERRYEGFFFFLNI